MRTLAAFALVAVASFGVACSSKQPAQAPSPAATPSSAPVASPNISFAAVQRETCATPGPAFRYVDSRSGRAYAQSQSQTFGSELPSPNFLNIQSLAGVTVPTIGIVRPIAAHDLAELTVVPDGPDANALLRHIVYQSTVAKARYAALAAGQPMPTSPAAEATAEAAYLNVVAPRLREEALHSNFDDNAYANDDGDPNHADPHNFAATCRFLDWQTPSGTRQTYTVVLALLHRTQDTSTVGFATTQTMVHNGGGDAGDGANVGWNVVGRWTIWAQGVTPTLLSGFVADNVQAVPEMAHMSWPAISFIRTPIFTPMRMPAATVSPALPKAAKS